MTYQEVTTMYGKRIVLSVVMCLCALCGVQAQTIQNGSMWWDGSVLYTAKVQGNSVDMNGVGEHSDSFHFGLTKVEGKSGEYILTGKETQAASLRAKVGWRVQYIRQDGMYFLAVRNPNGDAVWQMTLTPDNLEHSLAFERRLEQQPVSDQLSTCLLNTTYLGRFSKDQLRIMRNEILARHGWKFQSKDLQEYFGSQPWYKPGNNNNAIKLHIIEQLNIQLIKSEETVPDTFRSYGADVSQYAGGLAEDGRGPDEVNGKGGEIVVKTEAQFLSALGNNRTVVVAGDVHLNLSRVLENEEMFKNQPGRRWASDATAIISKQPLVVSESETDGRQLALVNFSGLVIKGERNSSIEVDPRYSYCLYLINCDHCEVQNLTIGHTEGGYCSGGVIGVRGGRQNMVKDCDLYGCGTYGLDLMETTDFSMFNSNVHDCTYGIMELRSCVGVKFNNCDFFNNREYSLIEGSGVEGLTFDKCRFYANWGDAPLFALDNTFYLIGCEIYHPTKNLGSIEMAEQLQGPSKWVDNPLDNSIKGRNIGPDQVQDRHFESCPLTVIEEGWKTHTIDNVINGSLGIMLERFDQTWPTWMVGQVREAMEKGLSKVVLDEETSLIVTVDAKNGFAEVSDGGTDGEYMEACFWNRSNGHKLLAVRLGKPTDPFIDFVCFYDYDPAKKCLTPEPEILKGYRWSDRKPYKQIFCKLPRVGKNVIVEEWGDEGPVHHTFTWDGMKPVYAKTEPYVYKD